MQDKYEKIGKYIFLLAGSLNVNQCGIFVHPQEQCNASGYFEGIISGGGLGEFYSAVLIDQLCGAVVNRKESLEDMLDE